MRWRVAQNLSQEMYSPIHKRNVGISCSRILSNADTLFDATFIPSLTHQDLKMRSLFDQLSFGHELAKQYL